MTLSSSKHFLLLSSKTSYLPHWLLLPRHLLLRSLSVDVARAQTLQRLFFSTWLPPLGTSSGLLALYAHDHADISGPHPWIPDSCSQPSLLCVYTSVVMCLDPNPRSFLQVNVPWSLLHISEGQLHSSKCRKHPWLLSFPHILHLSLREIMRSRSYYTSHHLIATPSVWPARAPCVGDCTCLVTDLQASVHVLLNQLREPVRFFNTPVRWCHFSAPNPERLPISLRVKATVLLKACRALLDLPSSLPIASLASSPNKSFTAGTMASAFPWLFQMWCFHFRAFAPVFHLPGTSFPRHVCT